MLFSQRKGLTLIRSTIQTDSIDDDLRNGLWNALQLVLWGKESSSYERLKDTRLGHLFDLLWHRYFKWPVDTLPATVHDAIKSLRDYFFSAKWYEVYDLIEFIISVTNAPDELIKFVNSVLKRDLAGYRVIDKKIVEVTAEEEVASIELALRNTSKLAAPHAHLKASLNLLADRKSPDYRNSIKEAISAVESLCQIVTGDPKATLGSALKALEQRSLIHPALKSCFSALYGYTSDADGIRHAMSQESNLTQTDAKFMLVACTAFINYLIGKAAEAGVQLS